MSASPQLSKTPGSGPERRRTPRRSIVDEQIIAVTLDGDNGGLMLDLAENGVAVQAVTALQPGKSIEMAFVLGEHRVPIRAHGVVRWAEPSGRAGIRLLAFGEGSSADIRAALLQPAVAAVAAEPPVRPIADPDPTLDVGAIEKEINGLEREQALACIAERTRELASASGVAIALGNRRQMTCRASAGAAPSVGARLQSDNGLSGECVRTGLLVRCNDTQTDARVDAEVCRQLDLRSAVLLPIVDSGEMCGVLEVFSNRPQAFASDDIRRFEQVAGLVAKVMREPAVPAALPFSAAPPEPVIRRAAAVPAAAATRVPASPPVTTPEAAPAEEASPRYSSPSLTLASPNVKLGLAVGGVIVLALASWGLLRGRHAAAPPATVAAAIPAAVAAPVPVEAQPVPVNIVLAANKEPAAKEAKVVSKPVKTPVANEQLAIRELPSAAPSAQPDPVAPPVIAAGNAALPELAVPAAKPASPRQIGGAVVAGRLVRRVDPVYPDLARRAHIGGTVVLNAVIRPDGKVGAVQVVSGNPLLARAAVDAVRQWRYDPFRLNGTAVQAEANVRLNFDYNLPPGR